MNFWSDLWTLDSTVEFPRTTKMEEAVRHQHAAPNTVFHCLYGYYALGMPRKELARVYCKSEKTIGNWIRVYEDTGTFQRQQSSTDRKFTKEHRRWLVEYYKTRPLAYLDEAQDAFQKVHNITISVSSVWRIIHEHGFTWKVLERRAIHIKMSDINRFAYELSLIDWSQQNLVFLDEVSFDNRGMVRKRGYALRGQKLTIRGEFQRKPRISILAFIGVCGIIDFFDTLGTFDRVKFTQCCKDFAYAERNRVRMYPGSNSVWILDGASIHRDAEIVHYLRSLGVVPIFLPAYCPFFNPIEYMFGYIKKAFQRHYNEASGRDLLPFVAETFHRFQDYDMSRVFAHCGWKISGAFDPTGPLSGERRTVPGFSDDDESLGFRERG